MIRHKTNKIFFPISKKRTKADIFLNEFTKELILNSGHRRKEIRKAEIISTLKEARDFNLINTSSDLLNQPAEITAPVQGNTNLFSPVSAIQQQVCIPEQMPVIENLPEEQAEGFYLNKIQSLINDRNVVSIECPGPGKFLSVKKMGRKMITRIVLSQDDINLILDKFSEQAMIPRIGGIFKAIAENLIITAIDSDVAGPRFIITKIIQRESSFVG